jgi:hypothetical protein
LDDEMDTWEQALHRFDDLAARDAQSAPSLQYSLPNFAHVPSNAALDISDFTSPPSKFIGISSKGGRRLSAGQRKRSTSSVSSLAPTTNLWQKIGLQSKSKQKDVITHSQVVSVIESHPFLPFCK